MINRPDVKTHDQLGRVWIGLDLLKRYFSEQGGFDENCNVVRAMVKKVGHQSRNVNFTDKQGTSSKRQKGSKASPWLYLDAKGVLEYNRDSGLWITSRDFLDNNDPENLEFKWEEDEEYKVRAAAVTSICCIRAKDGKTPRAVLDFILDVLKGKCGQKPSAPALPRSCPVDFIDDGDRRAASFDLSNYIAENYLACCYINLSNHDVVSGTRHPCLDLMDECHKRLELELFLQKRREASVRVWPPSSVSSSPIGASCITALYTLALHKVVTEKGSGMSQGTSADSSALLDDTIDKMLFDEADPRLRAKFDPAEGRPAKMKKSELAMSAHFYSKIFENFKDIGIRAAAAQAFCCICCFEDRNVSYNPRERKSEPIASEPLGLLTAFEWLIRQHNDPSTSAPLRKIIVSLMIDCITGKVGIVHRAAIMTNGKYSEISGQSRCANGPLGASYGEFNASGILTDADERNLKEFIPVASAINNGARPGFALLRKAGSTDAVFSGISWETVVRVAAMASKLWEIVSGRSGVVWNLGGGGGDREHRNNLEFLWGWLFYPSKKGCPALNKVYKWLDAKDPKEQAENVKKLRSQGLEVLDIEVTKDGALQEELEKLDAPVAEVTQVRRMASRAPFDFIFYPFHHHKN